MLIMLFKNINAQLCSYKKSVLLIKRYTSNYECNVKVFMDLFNMTKIKAEKYIRKYPSLAFKNSEHIIFSYNFCKGIGYSNKDILKNPCLITTHHLIKVQHYWALEETGCHNIHAAVLSRAKSILPKKIVTLKYLNALKPEADVVEHFLSYLKPSIKRPEKLQRSVDHLDDMTWTNVHYEVLRDWLKVRLNASSDDLNKLFRIHKMISNKSFRTIEENIQMAESIGISHEKILKCGYLLNNYPEYPKTVLKEFPNLAGLDMRKAMKSNPKLMMIDPKNILKIYGLLKEYNISDENIQKSHQVFTLNYDSVKSRLKEIQGKKELRLFFDYSNVVQSVIHQKKVFSRLLYLQKLNMRCASFKVLDQSDDAYFDNYIKEGKDINIKADLVNFLAIMFKRDRKEVSKIISRHPYYQCVPFSDMHDTYDYLIDTGYKNENIYRALHIILYPKDKIESTLKALKQDPDMDFYMLKQAQILNLVVYQIEKFHHFTGNGIWRLENFEEELVMPE